MGQSKEPAQCLLPSSSGNTGLGAGGRTKLAMWPSLSPTHFLVLRCSSEGHSGPRHSWNERTGKAVLAGGRPSVLSLWGQEALGSYVGGKWLRDLSDSWVIWFSPDSRNSFREKERC